MAELTEQIRLYEPHRRQPRIAAIGGGHGLSAMLRGLNEHARIVTTPWKDLTGAQLLATMEGSRDLVAEVLEEIAPEPHHEHHHHHHDHDEHEHHQDHDEHEHHHDGHCCHHHHHHDHDADEVFTSWGVETAKKFSKADIEHALTELDGGKYEITLYTSCCNADRGIYYYTTYGNHQITAVDMHRENLDGDRLVRYPLVQGEQIALQN